MTKYYFMIYSYVHCDIARCRGVYERRMLAFIRQRKVSPSLLHTCLSIHFVTELPDNVGSP